jgi:hypothetical protein
LKKNLCPFDLLDYVPIFRDDYSPRSEM